MKVLVTGVAGFIGMHVAQAFLARGDEVVGMDDLSDQYEVALKYARLSRIQAHSRFRFLKIDVSDRPAVNACFATHGFEQVVHLATQAGGGRAVTHPRASAQPNLVGFINMLEGCRQHGVPHMVYASSSNVYSGLRQMNLAQRVEHGPSVSEVESHKMPNELMAQTYSRLHGLATTGLRFFTVYGPWGRPDMSYYGFTRALLAGDPIPQAHGGSIGSGLTYVDDIVAGILQALRLPARTKAEERTHPGAQARVLNIGSHDPVRLLDFVAALENAVGRESELKMLPMSMGDADSPAEGALQRLPDLVGDRRSTMPLAEGVQRFVHWYLGYHGLGSNKEPSSQRRTAVFEDPNSVQLMPALRHQVGDPTQGQYIGGAH
jgi:UDP-glucuronate 4-epimerase